MTLSEVAIRQQHAHAFIEAARLVQTLGADAGIPNVGNTVGSLAVLAGIAAADAIAGATLRRRSASDNHADAVSLLKQSTDGKMLAQHLLRLVSSKTDVQYTPTIYNEKRSAELLTSATRLVTGMDEIVRKNAG